MSAFASISYSSVESTEITQWLTTCERLKSLSGTDQSSLLNTLNDHLESRTTLLGTKPSEADVALYQSLASLVSSWSTEQRTGKDGNPHIVRYLDFVQNSPKFHLSINDEDKIKVDPDDIRYIKPAIDAKAEKERSKKEKAKIKATTDEKLTGLVDRTLTGTGDDDKRDNGTKDSSIESKSCSTRDIEGKPQHQKKKEKAPKPQKTPAATVPSSVSLIDLRVGHILKAEKHPEADSLYVSTIAMGDKPGTDETFEYEGQVVRTVCSGLNGLVPLEEMQGRKIIVVCNLKPVKMRGIKSAAMVLAASPKPKDGEDGDHSRVVELVSPPEDAVAGEKVFFEGWKGEPEGVLNPKKKIWETFQPGFTTTDDFEVGFQAAAIPSLVTKGTEPKEGIAKLVTERGGVCKVKTLAGAVVR
ncbi:tRNA-aminoacylation cofactor ARC1 [Erysiphe neolycopersici]|uniref:tRNA-aminoacylation cofactor ARC1 n=1 Tax=Erysiphe neolycopersici TaxID=212602 RepID=A0A420HC40_9PEZI|nr:tRNA-aminoacylation cofactor ARC1 [Erysiphe neolycopersici]